MTPIGTTKMMIFTLITVISCEKTTHTINSNTVQLNDLLDNMEPHRRLRITPISKAIEVPCQNMTSNCGRHGICRISGANKFCQCDDGYFSLSLDKPCAEKGKSQTTMAILQYFFGWTGGVMFAMGWTALGVATLASCCLGCCSHMQVENPKISNEKKASCACISFMSYICLFGLYITGAVYLSTSKCVSSDGVPCDTWR